MKTPSDKAVRWRRRAEQLRELAAKSDQQSVRENLLAMAAAFEGYALKWDGTALVFHFAPRPREISIDTRTRQAS